MSLLKDYKTLEVKLALNIYLLLPIYVSILWWKLSLVTSHYFWCESQGNVFKNYQKRQNSNNIWTKINYLEVVECEESMRIQCRQSEDIYAALIQVYIYFCSQSILYFMTGLDRANLDYIFLTISLMSTKYLCYFCKFLENNFFKVYTSPSICFLHVLSFLIITYN